MPSVPGQEPPVGPGASPPIRPIVVSKATLSRLTPTAAATAAPVVPASPVRPALATKRPHTQAPHYDPAAALRSIARAARIRGDAVDRRAFDHLRHAGRAIADVDRLADVGSPVRHAPLFAAVPALTPAADTHPRTTAPDDRTRATPGAAKRARAAEIATAAGHTIRDALVLALIVGLTFALAAYALMRARLRFLTERDAVSFQWLQSARRSRGPGPRDPSPPRGGRLRPVPERSSAEKPPPRSPRPVDASQAGSARASAPIAAATRRPRHRPWTRDEIMAGLLIGCRAADERGALLSQRVLRTLAHEDPRVPSWSVVDRAARKAGETGGAWLREARRRHRYDGSIKAVPGPYSPDADLRETA